MKRLVFDESIGGTNGFHPRHLAEFGHIVRNTAQFGSPSGEEQIEALHGGLVCGILVGGDVSDVRLLDKDDEIYSDEDHRSYKIK